MFSPQLRRLGGMLLHPTCLPSSYGIGDLGPSTFRFIDFIHECKIKAWQILPLGPTGYGNSPYQCSSAFAGNPLLISPDWLISRGLLSWEEIKPLVSFPKNRVDYEQVIQYKWKVLERAHENYCINRGKRQLSKSIDFDSFVKENNHWLEDYVMFMSLKKEHDFQTWNKWEEKFLSHDPKALMTWKNEHEDEIELYRFSQYIFFLQWKEVLNYCHQKDVIIIGDIPFSVAHDSADVWTNPELFHIDDEGKPTYVTGVPPDYFSETGQRWGNPLYCWKKMKNRGYQWWTRLLKHWFSYTDMLRFDHFRGFESYWQIPASEETAIKGEWVSGPGFDFFLELSKNLGTLPVIAEDLGVITPAVEKFLQQTGFPGMRVLQFAFGRESSSENRFLPHRYIENTIVYTGTHDNDTTIGWFNNAPDHTRDHVLKYLNSKGEDIAGDFIRAAWSSVARMSIIPLQDLLRLGSEGRMNLPGSISGNWEWRFTWDQLEEDKSREMTILCKLYER